MSRIVIKSHGARRGVGDTPDDLTQYLAGLVSPAGPDALGYGAGGTGSTSQFLQGVVNEANNAGVSLPTGQQAAAVSNFNLSAWLSNNSTMIVTGCAILGVMVALAKHR